MSFCRCSPRLSSLVSPFPHGLLRFWCKIFRKRHARDICLLVSLHLRPYGDGITDSWCRWQLRLSLWLRTSTDKQRVSWMSSVPKDGVVLRAFTRSRATSATGRSASLMVQCSFRAYHCSLHLGNGLRSVRRLLLLLLLWSHETVCSTQRHHQYTQCQSWFFMPEWCEFCFHRNCCNEMYIQSRMNQDRQVNC